MIQELLYGRTRCYLIDERLLVDTDWAGTLPAFFACLQEKGIPFDRIRYLLVTHYHPDHMGIAADLMERGVTLLLMDVQRGFVHQSDAVFRNDRRHRFTPIDESRAVCLTCAESREFLKGIGICGEVIPTPGHSDDSVTLILDDERAAFVGDICPFEQVAYFHSPTLEASVRRIREMGVERVYYGHVPPETIAR